MNGSHRGQHPTCATPADHSAETRAREAERLLTEAAGLAGGGAPEKRLATLRAKAAVAEARSSLQVLAGLSQRAHAVIGAAAQILGEDEGRDAA